jgi:hypothetical protein
MKLYMYDVEIMRTAERPQADGTSKKGRGLNVKQRFALKKKSYFHI